MNGNLLILVIVGIALLALIIWMIVKNQRDKKKLEEKLNQDYRKPHDTESDIDIVDEKSV